MAISSSLLIAVAALFSAVVSVPVAQESNILFDGRLPWNTALSDLDSYSTSPYNAEYVIGAGQKWSDVLKFPLEIPSLFDLKGDKPFEVTINDKSVFSPGGNPQAGFRRSELMPGVNNGLDVTVQGITTFHFSIKEDIHRPLNYSHQYELVFIETNDYSSHVWTLKTGSAFGATKLPAKDAKTLRLGSSTAGGAPEEVLFSVPFGDGSWHNFAVETNWDKNTIAVYYSAGYGLLQKVVKTRTNDATGQGQGAFIKFFSGSIA
ncbi:hypothetical protein Q9L58_000709 [Maublancomyces gigas]|uniref:Glycoside hydrolase 131 catalytic N-terminal domain-containing protein n=1 Tax=Discina gigas TaxID=1032678 RepID=A0ABR3GX52_9PEZI